MGVEGIVSLPHKKAIPYHVTGSAGKSGEVERTKIEEETSLSSRANLSPNEDSWGWPAVAWNRLALQSTKVSC